MDYFGVSAGHNVGVVVVVGLLWVCCGCVVGQQVDELRPQVNDNKQQLFYGGRKQASVGSAAGFLALAAVLGSVLT